MKNYYQVLGLNENATLDEIKKAYKEYVVKFHPDKHNGDEFFKERFQDIQEAYNYLRSKYTNKVNNITTSTNSILSDSNVAFSCSHKNIYDGDSVTFKWDIDLPCSVYLKIVTDNTFFRIESNLSQHGTITINIDNKIEEGIVAILYCTSNYNTISKEIQLNLDDSINKLLLKDKLYLRLTKEKGFINSFFKILVWILTISYIYILIQCLKNEPFPTFTNIGFVNTLIEYFFYFAGWFMICYIVPLCLNIGIEFIIDNKIKEYKKQIRSRQN